jgi:potassium-transporting ATPase KdpC subunit
MLNHLRANLWLLGLSLLLCCVIYPGILLLVGQTLFPSQANGSLLLDQAGKPIGSRLIAQPFSGDEYFQPRPSAVSYNAAASGASNWAANNYLLRDRVARQLGPIVKYRRGTNAGKLVGPDVEGWFQKDHAGGKPGIVAQWAAAHPTLAQNWVKADAANAAFVTAWQSTHASDVARWTKDSPDNAQPKPEDLAVVFFTSFSHEHPGTFPVSVEHKTADGKTEKRIEPAHEGSDIQATFFDLWRQEHADADLEPVPADMVMASGSGLDPHITLKSALFQLDRVAGKWAAETKLDPADVRREIESLVRRQAEAPFGGLVGVELVNVLEVNLALQELFRPRSGETNRVGSPAK